MREKGIGIGLQKMVNSLFPNLTYRWEHPGAIENVELQLQRGECCHKKSANG
jgi:hypothetical protein